jgi:hypothetical protein
LHDTRRDANVLGVRAIIEEQILTKILLAVAAEEAMITRGGIGSDNALAGAKMENTFADGDHVTGHLMTEQGRRANHFGMIAAAKNLHIGSTREGGFNADKHFSRTNGGDRDRFEPNVLFSIQNGSLHSVDSYWHEIRSCGCTTTFNERSLGF